MALNIVFLDEYTLNDTDLSPIKKLGNYTGYNDTEAGQIVERCREADVIVANKAPLKAETLANLPNLKLICIAATGMNNVDLATAESLGVSVKNAADYSTYSVAEQTISGALALLKQTIYMDDYVKDGGYASSGKLFNYERQTYELYGKKWGIIGLGNIGRRVAELATAFGCGVSYYSTSGNNENKQYKRKELTDLLAGSDIVSIHAPLSRKTYHLLDYHQFSMMKKTAIVINVARGSIINENGLARALNDGLIAGAALDVYSNEPIAENNPLFTVRDKYKLVMTPHSAWASKESLQKLVEKVAKNIEDYINKIN